jgi:Leucine-rich repeat (LRR) protein
MSLYSLSDLTQLKYLDMSHNQFTGTISSESIQSLQHLEFLDVHQNFLSGPLPLKSLYSLSQLVVLDVSMNLLSGSFLLRETSTKTEEEVEEDDTWSHLQILGLGDNFFQSTLPSAAELGGDGPTFLRNLIFLDLSENSFSGALSSTFLSNRNFCKNVTILDLSQNQFTSTLPSELGNCVNLKHLSVHSNRMTGSLPEQYWTKLTSLNVLRLGFNEFSGPLDNEIGRNWSLLKSLELDSNLFTGTIPESFLEMISLGT